MKKIYIWLLIATLGFCLLALPVYAIFLGQRGAGGQTVAGEAAVETEYIIPGLGIINDTETSSEVIIPGGGIYNQQ
jgi:hypothetical protein